MLYEPRPLVNLSAVLRSPMDSYLDTPPVVVMQFSVLLHRNL
jgi:hypothetical protein